jgi:hypothetical protein
MYVCKIRLISLKNSCKLLRQPNFVAFSPQAKYIDHSTVPVGEVSADFFY